MVDDRSSVIKYSISMVIYGSIGYFLSFINAKTEFVAMCRGMIGTIFIFVVCLVKNKGVNVKAIKDNLLVMMISGISLGLNWLFLFEGYRHSVSVASLCNYTAPIIVLIILTIYNHSKLSLTQILCIIASFIGIILVSGVLNTGKDVDKQVLVYGFLAALGFVSMIICNKKIKDVDQFEKTFVQLLFATLTLVPFVIINKSVPTNLDKISIINILVLGIFNTGIAYIFYFGSLGYLEPSKIAIFGYLEPAVSVFVGVCLLNEYASSSIIIGAVLIIGSAMISELFLGKKS